MKYGGNSKNALKTGYLTTDGHGWTRILLLLNVPRGTKKRKRYGEVVF